MFLIYVVNVNLTITLFILKDIPIQVGFMALNWIILHVKIMPIRFRDFAMQAFVLPIIPLAIYAAFCWLFGTYIFPLGGDLIGDIPFAIITIAMVLFLWPIIIVCPLMGIFGSWDDYSADSFRRTVELSGPSKFMMQAMYKASIVTYNKSPLKGRFPIKGSDLAVKEALELEENKRLQDVRNVSQSNHS
jgi:hypothetical protein